MGATLIDRPSTALTQADIAAAGDPRYAQIYTPSPGALFGLTMSTAGASTTLSVAAGFAADSTNVRLMKLAATMAKTTSAWALGTAAGGLDTGAIAASTWYHWYLIYNPSTAAVDVVFSATATPALGPTTLPSGYTLFRRIGSMKTNGSSQWTAFTQLGDEFLWVTPVSDVSGVSITTTPLTPTFSVPTGVNVWAKFTALIASTASGYIYFYALDRGTQTASANNASLVGIGASDQSAGDFTIRVNTSAQIGAVASVAVGSYDVGTYGWIDTRGKLS